MLFCHGFWHQLQFHLLNNIFWHIPVSATDALRQDNPDHLSHLQIKKKLPWPKTHAGCWNDTLWTPICSWRAGRPVFAYSFVRSMAKVRGTRTRELSHAVRSEKKRIFFFMLGFKRLILQVQVSSSFSGVGGAYARALLNHNRHQPNRLSLQQTARRYRHGNKGHEHWKGTERGRTILSVYW